MNVGKVHASEIEIDICETLPRSILCEMKQSQERSRLEFEKRQQELEEARKKRQQEELQQYLLGIKEKYGYNPLFYTLKDNLYGNTLTIFSRAGWVRMTVDSEKGDVYALYTEADRNIWSGGTNWHDKKTINLTFTLDQKACEKFSRDKNCTFSGTDKVNLGSFFQEHELVKYGTWSITYLKDDEKKTFEFKMPLNKKPEKSKEEFNPQKFRIEFCTKFPESISCLYLENKEVENAS
ncbi:hypothetical protein [Nostoc sp. WHI]|uniref:hypothetical protein n=1 Tax=Nostoc sp. WHI TaxID=2650611 RepID=UPI0018C5FEBD|nr:hypothetical protein [Nostoc sp. WHI]MBG1266795.1 hypothetical protein [Nostoc sp. WHI]